MVGMVGGLQHANPSLCLLALHHQATKRNPLPNPEIGIGLGRHVRICKLVTLHVHARVGVYVIGTGVLLYVYMCM